ncbi:MAG: CDP-glycerol glycerophosphotransferase family protein [Clostridiales bacterium]|nr:CDP-glycerol glycerophosphotransferase family protein [Clostridiales bacterium]
MNIKKAIKTTAYNVAKVSPPLRRVYRRCLFAYRRFHYWIHTRGLTVDKKLVVFCTFSGKGYSDSPKAIYEYMLSQEKYSDYRFVWIFREPDNFRWLEENRNTTIVRWASKEYERAMASAGYWIFNYRVSDHVWPKEDQTYVECWHGTPLKRLGYDITAGGNVMNTAKEIQRKYDLDSAKFKYLISPSPYCSEKFASAWNLTATGKENALLEQGYPRNDFLLCHTQADVDDIKARLHITPGEIGGRKIVLYAPTWRDNQHDDANGYSYTLGLDFQRLRQALGEEIVVLFRAHYLVASQFDFAAYEGFVYNVSSYPDINHLYLAADLLITDYSSVFFDYANLRKPMLFYMYDLAAYRDDIRGFYIGLDELPGPIVETEDELLRAIPAQLTDSSQWAEQYETFCRKFSPFDDGHASRRALEIILGEKPNVRASRQRETVGV